ncbi:MAG: hypothetical protein GY903_01245 [Fuerstiella sp.]|nr:hypothetical protein [Fuerstiella sp.]MCP4853104.1 hypothetical protein [Fuerstiella sp.]
MTKSRRLSIPASIRLKARRVSLAFLLALTSSALAEDQIPSRNIAALDILNGGYPRAFFFRASEGAHSESQYRTYESWDSNFNRLQGIIGKCLDEECIGRERRNPAFFSEFKRRHPKQAVLLHFNGNARDPRYQTEKYFAGHWIYRESTMITANIPAETGETSIEVEDARDFRINIGRYRTSNDDIALFRINDQGKHDWYHCEQVQLLNVDYEANTITVKRGCYGTKPLAFKAGESRAASHAVEGPWGQRNNIMWYYNFSTHCPRDHDGMTCADHLVDDLAEWFGTQGPLAAFDGLEFDVMYNRTHGDTDGDGHADDGLADGINNYGIGMVEFARALRKRMTDNFIIQGDGALGQGGMNSQRAWGILNGIESEGWPNHSDWEMADWSGGLNRHFFWRDNARDPVFNYVNHKWTQSVPGRPGARMNPDVPFSRHRLSFAASQFFDAMICYSFAPRNDPDQKFGIWDELRCGIDQKIGWLGKPEGPAVRLATQQIDIINGRGAGTSLADMISGPVTTKVTPDGVQIRPSDSNAGNVRFTIRDIPTDGPHLFVPLVMKGDSMPGYPRETARFATVSASGGMLDLMADQPLEIGMNLRSAGVESPLDESSGASLRERPAEIADDTRPAYFVHPPYRSETGYTYWIQEADVRGDSELRFSIGMGKQSPLQSDGVWFKVYAAAVTNAGIGDYRKIFEVSTKLHEWLPQTVALQPFSGQRVRLKFVADCGPRDNSTTDHAHWADVRIVAAGTTDSDITQSTSSMTWVNNQTFRSGFCFRNVRSSRVDLTVSVENSAAVVVESIAAHAHPDAIYRVFEGGIVLANPSRMPYVFDLSAITPGRTYRRIQATANQDTETNNGHPVGDAVTLGDRDGLFLVRVK